LPVELATAVLKLMRRVEGGWRSILQRTIWCGRAWVGIDILLLLQHLLLFFWALVQEISAWHGGQVGLQMHNLLKICKVILSCSYVNKQVNLYT